MEDLIYACHCEISHKFYSNPSQFRRVCCPGEQSGLQPSQEVDRKDHPGWDAPGRSRWLDHSLCVGGGWTTVFMEHALQKGKASEWEPQSKCCLRNRSPKAQQTPLCLINIPVATPSLAHGCLGFLCDLGKGRLHQLKTKTNFPPSLHTH